MSENEGNTEEQKASRKDFNQWYSQNPGVENADIYDAFPNNPQSTLRRWKMESNKTKSDSPNISPESSPGRDDALSLNNVALMRGTPFNDKFFAGMKISDVKDWLIQMKQILKAPVDPLTKLNKIMEVVMHGCAVANILWEEVNIMQGTDPGQIAPNTEIEKL